MARKNLATQSSDCETQSLDTLIPQYAQNKMELDSYKKICDGENAQIKTIMAGLGTSSYSAGGYTAKCVEVDRTSLDTAKAVALLSQHMFMSDREVPTTAQALDIIKYEPVVDETALEKYLYKHTDDAELIDIIRQCTKHSVNVQLRISKTKKTQEEE